MWLLECSKGLSSELSLVFNVLADRKRSWNLHGKLLSSFSITLRQVELENLCPTQI